MLKKHAKREAFIRALVTKPRRKGDRVNKKAAIDLYEGKCLRPGTAGAKRGKHVNRMSTVAKQARNAQLAGDHAKFWVRLPLPVANGADLRDLKAGKRQARHKSRRKGIDWSNRYIGTPCI